MRTFSEDLSTLSSAEDFFAYFDVHFDPRVMAASRLHILKRFHDYLAKIDGLEEFGDAVKREVYRAQLQRAYGDFVAGTALTERVFPVLRSATAGFVALSAVHLKTGQVLLNKYR